MQLHYIKSSYMSHYVSNYVIKNKYQFHVVYEELSFSIDLIVFFFFFFCFSHISDDLLLVH